MTKVKPLSIAYTPDSDDAFYYDGLETGQVQLPGYWPEFSREPMSVLNRARRCGACTTLQPFPQWSIHKLLSITPFFSVGTSVGRGYGPVLVSKEEWAVQDLRGRGSVCPASRRRGGFCCAVSVPKRSRSKWPTTRSPRPSPRGSWTPA